MKTSYLFSCPCAVKDKGDTEIREYEEKRGIIKAKMDELKSVLYAKFGNTINLEE